MDDRWFRLGDHGRYPDGPILQKKTQFSIRLLLIAMLLAPCVIIGYQQWQRHVYWKNVHTAVDSWAQDVDRSFGIQSHYMTLVNSEDDQMPEYSIHTAEPIKILDSETYKIVTAFHPETKPDPTRFFIVPGWKWVDDIDSAVKYWQTETKPAK